jgi:hypothetical protein
MFLKRLFYASAAILCLALAYHYGATSAIAQAPGDPVVAAAADGSFYWVVTANGDVYCPRSNVTEPTWIKSGNVFGGGPVPAQRETFGALKSRYRRAAQPSQDK